jgi:hypothetical protein
MCTYSVDKSLARGGIATGMFIICVPASKHLVLFNKYVPIIAINLYIT